jgi:hypothetical protein
VVHCVDAYQFERGLQHLKRAGSISTSLGGFVRRQAMLPIISDFLFDDVDEVLRELARLSATHDVCLAMVDAAEAFAVPRVSAGWVEAFDVESGRTRVMSRGALAQMGRRVGEYQDAVARRARALDLDVVRLSSDRTRFEIALMEFVAERRLRRRK